ncbi:NACHT, LRR and PYD domains-containing protein 12-like [Aulostomus maculatus]
MGSLCSALRRSKISKDGSYKPDQNTNEISTQGVSRETSPLLLSGLHMQNEAKAATEAPEDETSSKETGAAESRTLACDNTMGVNVQRPCLAPVPDLSSELTEEEKEAEWVNSNRANLIQSIELVMPIADEMLERRAIHKETYSKIRAAGTPEAQMRELYSALTTPKVKSIFSRILKEIQPEICETDSIEEVIQRHKESLKAKCHYEFEGTERDQKHKKSLEAIFTELHIIQGESDQVKKEHEIWDIQRKSGNQAPIGIKIHCNDIFRSTPEDDRPDQKDAIRTVMTKGIAGIGKTVSVKKFILDWAGGKANKDLDFIVMLPFRELNLVMGDPLSLETLVRDFHPELKNIARIFANHKVLFIFDGLDESQLPMNFKTTKKLTETAKESSVDVLVTNIIRGDLVRDALVWITSRPGAVCRIPRKYIYQWTEVQGFNDEQKKEYFRRRFEDKRIAERIIDHITTSRSLYIMCHIPIFCWIAAKVIAHMLSKADDAQAANIKIPTTLTEMYTYFLYTQIQIATEKYDEHEASMEETFKANEDFIFKLGKLAFEYLTEGKIIFRAGDLKKYEISIDKAGVHCGLCTEILKEESVISVKKLYCFVHLTIQEYFAALFVYRQFACKKIDSLILRDFLLQGSEDELKELLDSDPVDIPLDELMEISIANSTQRQTGELDMFLRFLIGLSLDKTQEMLQGLIEQTEEHSEMIEKIKTNLKEIDLNDCSPDRCLNLVHCLIELKDSSLHDTVQQYLHSNPNPESQLSPVQCSALADSVLMSNTPLDEFNLKKYRPSYLGIFRLIPAVRNSRKVRISGVTLNSWVCGPISSALQMPNSVLTELHLTNSSFHDKGMEALISGLLHPESKLEALSFSGTGLTEEMCENLASVIESIQSNLRELELSGNILRQALPSVLPVAKSPTLRTLRLNRNYNTAHILQELGTTIRSNRCYLRELELNHTCIKDSDLESLVTIMTSKNCALEILSLSHNKVTEKGCEMLASALSSTESHLMELDLSYNDLLDSGVKTLCDALMNPHCGLTKLRLSFCRVTGDGCRALALALKSDHCSLRELDLSFNHLSDQGVKLLSEIQRDSRCSLEKLNVDHNEECWFDLKLLRQYACNLTLDPNTAALRLILSEGNKKAVYAREKQDYPDHPERFENAGVLCKEGLAGRHYWETECVSADVGLAYKSMARMSNSSVDFSFGQNEKSWCWSGEGCFCHNDSSVELLNCSTMSSTIGVYLDWPAGILSFFEVFPDELIHLYTAHTSFTEPLYPGYFLYDGSIHICKIE